MRDCAIAGAGEGAATMGAGRSARRFQPSPGRKRQASRSRFALRFSVRAGNEARAAEKKKRAVLRGGGGEDAFGTGPGLEFAPAVGDAIEIEGEEDGLRGAGVGVVKSAGDIDGAAQPRAGVLRERAGQRGKRVEAQRVRAAAGEPHVGEVRVGVAAADEQHAFGQRQRHAVAGGLRELAGGLPMAVRIFEQEDAIVPDFGATGPRRAVGKIRAAGDEKGVVDDAGVAAGEAEGVRQRGQFLPVEHVARRLRVSGGGEADGEEQQPKHHGAARERSDVTARRAKVRVS